MGVVQGAHCDFPPRPETQSGGAAHPLSSQVCPPPGTPPQASVCPASSPLRAERLRNPSGDREHGLDVLFLVPWEKSQLGW